MDSERKHRNSSVTSKIMSAVRSEGSKAELALAKAMWSLGLRYRKHPKGILGKPDFAFIRPRVVVFVDGDFWHGKGWKARGFRSWEEQFKGLRDSAFWRKKIADNMARDKRVNEELGKEGWLVVRCLESEVLKDASQCAKRVQLGIGSQKAKRLSE